MSPSVPKYGLLLIQLLYASVAFSQENIIPKRDEEIYSSSDFMSGNVQKSKVEKKIEPVIESKKPKASQGNEVTQNWQYSSEVNPMSDKPVLTARIVSWNGVNLDSHFKNPVRLMLEVVIDENNDKKIFFHPTDGVPSNMSKIRVKFEKTLEVFSIIESKRGKSYLLSISPSDEKRFLSSISKSQKMKVEVDFFNHGIELFDFQFTTLQGKFIN